jgi:hypothetical protein
MSAGAVTAVVMVLARRNIGTELANLTNRALVHTERRFLA